MANLKSLGMDSVRSIPKSLASGSTDMGNVTQIIPGIHPMFCIPSTSFPHTRPFATAAGKTKHEKNF